MSDGRVCIYGIEFRNLNPLNFALDYNVYAIMSAAWCLHVRFAHPLF